MPSADPTRPSAAAPAAGRCAIAVMAKAPRPGQVKTRLQSALTPEAAAALSGGFLRDITENIGLAGRRAAIDPWVAYAPAGLEMLFAGMLAAGTKLVLADGSIGTPDAVRGFGRCLLHAAQALFERRYGAVCLLNADSPTLPTAMLAQAAEALAAPGDRVVLGPAEDGGYYLIGMKAPHPALFADIDWSTEQVAAQTRARAASLGLELVELAPWYDVDDAAALRRLLDELSSGAAPAGGALAPYAAPATAACARRLGLFGRLDEAGGMTRGGATLAGLAALGAVLAALTLGGLATHLPGAADQGSPARQALFVALGAGATCAYFAAAWLVLRGARAQRAVWLVLGVALALRLMVLAAPPFLSSDLFRYVWDGRVQIAGINPYRYVPADPALEPLRDAAIYPHIDRAYYAHTIYPPAAQLLFRAIASVAQTATAERAAMLAFDLLAILVMLRLLARAGLDPARVLVYAWNPLSVWEFAGNGHVDAASVALLALAMLARVRGRGAVAGIGAGIALGAAALVKFLPLATAPAFWRPQDSGQWRDWTVPAAVLATMALLYLPFLGDGAGVLGFLPGYAAEEGFGNGRAIYWLDALSRLVPLPPFAGTLWLGAAAVLLIGTGLWMTLVRPPPRAGDPVAVAVARDVAVLGTLLTLAITPHYPWYFVWLALPSCLAPMPATILLSAIPILQYHDPYGDRVVQFSQIYLPFLAVSAVWLWRRRIRRTAPIEAAVRSF